MRAERALTEEPPAAAAGRVVSESLAYTTIDAAQNILALLAVPASLFWLTPADMGVVTLALVGTQVAMTLTVLGLDFSVVRFYVAWPEDERHERAVGALVVVLTAALVLMAVTFALSPSVMPTMHAVALASVSAGAGLAVRAIPLAVFRVTSALRLYAWIVVAGSALQAVLQIGLLAAGQGVVGFLVGTSIASWAAAVWAIIALTRGRPLAWRWPDARTATLAGWNLSATVANRATANVDRLAVWLWATFDALGVYGTASRWSLPLRMVSGGTKLAIAPALSRAERNETSAGAAAPIAALVTLLALLAVVLLGLSSLLVVTPWRPVIGEFQRLLALLLAAQLIGCLTLIGQVLLYYLGRSGRSAGLAVVSAAAAVVSLILLVPRHGAFGAAAAQCLASGATLVAFAWFAGRDQWSALRASGPLLVLVFVLAMPWVAGPRLTALVSIAGAAVLARWAWRDWRGTLSQA